MPRTADEAATLVFHEWADAQALANQINLICAAFDGAMANIKELDIPASDVPDFCKFLRDELASLYGDARRIENRLVEASRVFHHKLPKV
jgi:hypothetical protein